MNPNNNQPGFELPTPQPSGSSEVVPGETDRMVASPEVNNGNNAPAPQPSTPYQTGPSTAPVTTDPFAATSPMAANPVIADDNDLIEKEWVQKAKQIVAETKDDPYRQNKEISNFKADYLKKRYDKDIKVEET